MKEIVTAATINLFQANMGAMIAKVRYDERAHFEAEWAQRTSCMAMDGENIQPMDETGQKEKRKPEEQSGREDKIEDLTKIPMTPEGNPAQSEQEAAEAAAAAAAAIAAGAQEQETGLEPVAKAKAGARRALRINGRRYARAVKRSSRSTRSNKC